MSQSLNPAATKTEEYKLPSDRPLYITPNVFGAYTTALDEKTRQFMEEATAYSQGTFPVKWLQTFIRRLAAKDMELQDRERQLMLQYQQFQSDRYHRPQTHNRGNRNRGGNTRRGGRYEDRSNANGRQSRHESSYHDRSSHQHNGRRRENNVVPRVDRQEINYSSAQWEDPPTTFHPTDEHEDGECE